MDAFYQIAFPFICLAERHGDRDQQKIVNMWSDQFVEDVRKLSRKFALYLTHIYTLYTLVSTCHNKLTFNFSKC